MIIPTRDDPAEVTSPMPELQALLPELVRIRRDLHAHPEVGFEEFRTSAIVAEQLESYGAEVHTGIAGTGVVGVIRGRDGPGAIGLRADMDALPIQEETSLAYRSTIAGRMHGCGHDGHTAMLLGAARVLARRRDFTGTAYVIFQPAEEGQGGGRKMVEEGLFDRFPMDAVYGMHNVPGMAAGTFAVMPGPMMASFDLLDITVRGTGGHAAFPHRTTDSILAGAKLIEALQSIVSRRVDPLDAAVLSITTFHAGDTHNVIPAQARLTGTVRVLKAEVWDAVEAEIARICAGVAQTMNLQIDLLYERRYPPTVNHPAQAALAFEAAARVAGADRVSRDAQPLMAAEDFAFMLEACPGAYIWIGNGVGSKGGCMVHNPGYDFNDEILVPGVAYWLSLVDTALGHPPR